MDRALPQMQLSGADAVVVSVGIETCLVLHVVQIEAVGIDAGVFAGGGQGAGAADPERSGDTEAIVRLVENGFAVQLQDQVSRCVDGCLSVIAARAEAVEIQRFRGGIIAHRAVAQHVFPVFLCDLRAQNPDVVGNEVGLLCPCVQRQAGETAQKHQQRQAEAHQAFEHFHSIPPIGLLLQIA